MRNIKPSYFLRRILAALITLWIALTINFFLPRMMGGDPATSSRAARRSARRNTPTCCASSSGWTRACWSSTFRIFKQLLQGNMGISYSVFQVPVSQIIGQALPWTLLIVLTSTLISFAIAWVLGMLAALKKGGVFDTLVVGGSFYVQSMPYFFVAMLLLIWFGFELKWFPMSHALPSGLGDSVPWYTMVGYIASHAFFAGALAGGGRPRGQDGHDAVEHLADLLRGLHHAGSGEGPAPQDDPAPLRAAQRHAAVVYHGLMLSAGNGRWRRDHDRDDLLLSGHRPDDHERRAQSGLPAHHGVLYDHRREHRGGELSGRPHLSLYRSARIASRKEAWICRIERDNCRAGFWCFASTSCAIPGR